MRLGIVYSLGNLNKGLKALETERMRQALEEAVQIIFQSTRIGYSQRKSPDGTSWAPNPPWWSEIKGQSTPLTGPISRVVRGGPLMGMYELAHHNRVRMQNSLTSTISPTVGTASIHYTRSAEERAALNQEGGDNTIEFNRIGGSQNTPSPFQSPQTLVFDVNIVERPHLGVATYPRVGTKTDGEWIEEIFGDKIALTLDEVGDGL